MLVPVKDFRRAKLRLAPELSDAERAALARQLAETVLAAAAGAPRYVVCDSDLVADWAVGQGAEVLFTPGLGLSGAVTAGVAHVAWAGATVAVVAHADLPHAHGLASLGAEDEVLLVPDRRLDGTNVIALPTASGFRFSYGKGSFARHRAEARRLGITCRVRYDSRLAVDVDHPGDLHLVAGLTSRPATP